MYSACTLPVKKMQQIITCPFSSIVQSCMLVRMPSVAEIITASFSVLDLHQCFHCMLLLPLFYHSHTFISFWALTETPLHISHLKRWLITGDLAWTEERCGCGWVDARLVVGRSLHASERLTKPVAWNKQGYRITKMRTGDKFQWMKGCRIRSPQCSSSVVGLKLSFRTLKVTVTMNIHIRRQNTLD